MKESTTDRGAASRRAFLKGTALTAAGVVVTFSGGRFVTTALAEAARAGTASAGGDLSFVQITDTHIGAHSPANPNVVKTFEEAVTQINALPRRPAFVMHTGDHVHLSKASEFDTVRQIVGTIKADRVFHVPGEHDIFVDQGKRYLQTFGKGTQGSGYFSFDLKGVHFLGLVNHASEVGTGQGLLGAEQLAFIKRDLAGISSDTPLVVFCHAPLLAVYPRWGWATSDMAPFQALVARFSSVTALSGHIHQLVTKTAGNMVMHTANSTAYPLHPPGQVAPTPLVLPSTVLPTRIGIRTASLPAGSPMLDLQDRPLA